MKTDPCSVCGRETWVYCCRCKKAICPQHVIRAGIGGGLRFILRKKLAIKINAVCDKCATPKDRQVAAKLRKIAAESFKTAYQKKIEAEKRN